MGFLKDIVGGAIKGVKSLVENAKVGKAATAAGFMQPSIVKQQVAQETAAVAKSNNVLLIVFASFIGFVLLLVAIFKRK